jgi:hypothetical protein
MLIAFTVDPTPAQEVINQQPEVIPQTVGVVDNNPVVQEPVVESVVMDKLEILINETRQSPADAKANQPFGSVMFFVSVLGKEGEYTQSDITMEAPGNVYGESLEGKTTTNSGNPATNKYYTGLLYVPDSAGEKTVTFKSGELIKTVTIDF